MNNYDQCGLGGEIYNDLMIKYVNIWDININFDYVNMESDFLMQWSG